MKIFWLDLETTGLDPAKDIILELAIAVAEFEAPTDILGTMHAVIHPEGIELPPMHQIVFDMHKANGLLADVAESKDKLAQVEAALLSIVPQETNYKEFPTLAGNSVHFDLAFLRVHMPRVAERLSHRVLDVSAVNLFCRSLGMPKPEKIEAHRAMSDVHESIRQYEICKDWILMT